MTANKQTNKSFGQPVLTYVKHNTSQFVVLAMIIVLSIYFGFSTDTFLSSTNVMNIVRQSSIYTIIGCSVTMVMISGTIDISIGGQMACATVISGLLMTKWGWPIIPACIIAIMVGAVFGFMNGYLITKFNLAPMIVTLAIQTLAYGIANLLTSGLYVYDLPSAFKVLGRGYVGKIPLQVIIMLVFLATTHVLLSKTVIGRRIYAIGGNEMVAKLAGIDYKKYRILLYTVNGMVACFGGLIVISRMGSAMPDLAQNYSLEIMTSVIIGGTLLGGGSGNMIGTFLGVVLITIISNGLNISGVSTYWQSVVQAAILVVVIILNRRKD